MTAIRIHIERDKEYDMNDLEHIRDLVIAQCGDRVSIAQYTNGELVKYIPKSLSETNID